MDTKTWWNPALKSMEEQKLGAVRKGSHAHGRRGLRIWLCRLRRRLVPVPVGAHHHRQFVGNHVEVVLIGSSLSPFSCFFRVCRDGWIYICSTHEFDYFNSVNISLFQEWESRFKISHRGWIWFVKLLILGLCSSCIFVIKCAQIQDCDGKVISCVLIHIYSLRGVYFKILTYLSRYGCISSMLILNVSPWICFSNINIWHHRITM